MPSPPPPPFSTVRPWCRAQRSAPAGAPCLPRSPAVGAPCLPPPPPFSTVRPWCRAQRSARLGPPAFPAARRRRPGGPALRCPHAAPPPCLVGTPALAPRLPPPALPPPAPRPGKPAAPPGPPCRPPALPAARGAFILNLREVGAVANPQPTPKLTQSAKRAARERPPQALPQACPAPCLPRLGKRPARSLAPQASGAQLNAPGPRTRPQTGWPWGAHKQAQGAGRSPLPLACPGSASRHGRPSRPGIAGPEGPRGQEQGPPGPGPG